MTVSTKEGNLVLADLSVPDGTVDPGTGATVSVTVQNHAKFLSPFDDDRCHDGVVPGYRYKVLVRVDGDQYTPGVDCIEGDTLYGSHEKEVTIDTPNSNGTYDVKAKIVMPNSGKESDWMARQIEVYSEGDAPDEPDDGGGWPFGGDDNDDGNDGDDGDDGDDDDGADLPWPFGDGGDGADFVDKLDTLILVIILLGAMYAAGQLFDVQLGGAGS